MDLVFRSMTAAEFAAYQSRSLQAYARDRAQAGGISLDRALGEATRQIADILPAGASTAGHEFYALSLNGRQVGDLWLHLGEADAGKKRLFIYDINIDESLQGQGLGTTTLQWVDDRARQLRASSVGLHVFGHNPRALKLYQRQGFQITNISMRKDL